MYFFAQKSDTKRERWLTLPANTPQDQAKFKHVSVYQYQLKDEESKVTDDTLVIGDLMFDLDSPDLGEAINWAQRLLKLLSEKYSLDLHCMKLYCSGSKGFHITIPQRVFDPLPVAIPQLYNRHRFMAVTLSEQARIKLDLNLYARRHLVRLPGQREDGRWKVPITVEQLFELTPEGYVAWVSEPRTLEVSHLTPANYLCEALYRLWTEAGDYLAEKNAKKKKSDDRIPLASRFREELSRDAIPPCMEWMRDRYNLNTQEGAFNKIAMNVGSFLALTGISEEAKEAFIDQLAEAHANEEHPAQVRRGELMARVQYAQEGKLAFSCKANRAALTAHPCRECFIDQAVLADAAERTSVQESEVGYYTESERGGRRMLTDFLLNPRDHIVDREGSAYKYAGQNFEIEPCSHTLSFISRDITFANSHWTSASNFRNEVIRHGGHIYFTGETALAQVHTYLAARMGVQELYRMKTEKLGTQFIDVGQDDPLIIWVEPEWSYCAGVQHTIQYTGNTRDVVDPLRGSPRLESQEDVEMMLNLMRSNDPIKVATMLGWACACHLKEHLAQGGQRQFPLLHIAGQPGSGKSMSASVYAALTGAMPDNLLTVTQSTPSPLRQAISQTTSVARVFDEFNRANMGQERYHKVLELLKACYFRQDVPVGTLSAKKLNESTAATINQKATTPMIYLSREATDYEELVQRSLIVRIDKRDHGIDQREEYFHKVQEALHTRTEDGSAFTRWAKSLVYAALHTSQTEALDRYRRCRTELNFKAHDRLLNNLAITLMGLDLLRGVHTEYPELDWSEFDERLLDLRTQLLESWHTTEAEAVRRAQVWGTAESLMKLLAIMARSGELTSGKHFLRLNDTLYLEPMVLYLPYRLYCQSTQQVVEAQSADSMQRILSEADYCAGNLGLPHDPLAKGWLAFDLLEIERRGINVDGYRS